MPAVGAEADIANCSHVRGMESASSASFQHTLLKIAFSVSNTQLPEFRDLDEQ
jgi:hypothetical protein